MPEKYETSIASLKNAKDLSKITLAEVIHALQAQEQQRLMRQEHAVESALLAKSQQDGTWKRKKYKKNHPTSNESSANNPNKGNGKKKSYPP